MNRIELFCHSRFDMKGGLLDARDIIGFLEESDAVGVTDYATILGWPSLKKEKQLMKNFGKLILGCEIPVIFNNGEFSVYYLVKNDIGKKNLYRLISEAEEKYKKKRIIRIPDELFVDAQYREGLLVGGNEEIVAAINDGAPIDILEILASDYDFLVIDAYDENEAANMCIAELGERLNIPVVATCSPRIKSEEDKFVYDILIWDKCSKVDKQGSLRTLQTTENMLNQLSYLPKEKAYEAVVSNTHLIAQMCDEISVDCGEQKYPYIENQDDKLKSMCYQALQSIYCDDDIPENVENRLGLELDAIKQTNTAFVFLQLKNMIEEMDLKSYEICCRGKCGNSYVAYLVGLTDFNPLEYELLPELCFGLNGDKPIDINIMVPSDRQKEAHALMAKSEGIQDYLFEGVYGIYGEISAKRAIKKYEEDNKIKLAEVEKQIAHNRLKTVVRATGAHPSGRMLIPDNIDKFDYFPLLYLDENTATTYFDYRERGETFYKLDILGHDNLMMLGNLFKHTHADSSDVDFSDEKIAELFEVCDDSIWGCADIPVFSKKESMELLKAANPKCFNDLVKVIGLIYSRGIYANIIKKQLIENKIALDKIISTKDDFFEFLIRNGMTKEHALEKISSEQIRGLFPKASAISYAQMIWRLGFFRVYYAEAYL